MTPAELDFCTDGFHSGECPMCGLTADERDDPANATNAAMDYGAGYAAGRAAAREPAGAGLREAAQALVDAEEAVRDAINGVGHPGTPHDRDIHMDPCTSDPGIHVYSPSSDCAACGGAEYGTEDTCSQALGDLRAALGMERRPWEGPGLRAALSEPKP